MKEVQDSTTVDRFVRLLPLWGLVGGRALGPVGEKVQGYLAHKKQCRPGTL